MPIGEHARVNCKRRTPPGDKCLASHAPYRPGASADRLPRQTLRLEPPIRQRRDLRPSGAESCKSQCAAGGYLFWGLECPMGNDVHCQCSSALGGTPLDASYCEGNGDGNGNLWHSHDHCVGAYEADGYRFGDYLVGSVYSTADSSSVSPPAPSPPLDVGGDAWYSPGRGQQLGSWTPGADWTLSFDLFPRGTTAPWASILHVGSENGLRLPGIWFWPNTYSLHICFDPGPGGQACIDTDALTPNSATAVKVVQNGGTMTAHLNRVASGAVSVSHLDVSAGSQPWYMSDPWYAAADVQVRRVRMLSDAPIRSAYTSIYEACEEAYVDGQPWTHWFVKRGCKDFVGQVNPGGGTSEGRYQLGSDYDVSSCIDRCNIEGVPQRSR